MCGIVGVWSIHYDSHCDTLVEDMLASIVHRGPDGRGVWKDQRLGIHLGHQRLAVVDLSPLGSQPMESEDGQLVVTFNGEIYNFKEIRASLESQGVTFRSNSDTEVLLKGYERWGVDVLDKLVGMYAFALWDGTKEQLFLARDRAGEKPLYYAHTSDGFCFASEVQALSLIPWVDRRMNPASLALYLQYQYIPAPYSIYKGIQKLPPAHAMIIRVGEAPRIWRYWDPTPLLDWPRLHLGENEAVESLESLLVQAIRGQMISDVPLGAFLSGGFDSSVVVGIMTKLSSQKVRTFTIGFDVPGYNESEHAAAVAKHLGTNHTAEILTESDALNLIQKIPTMYGEPFGDSSALPTHLVSLVARKHVTVSLSGDGGDEAFGGYARYDYLNRIYPWMRMATPFAGLLNLSKGILPRQVQRALPLLGSPAKEVYRGMVSLFSGDEVKRVVGMNGSLELFDRAWEASGQHSPRRAGMLADLLTYMPEAILTKVDRAAMAVSLETRAPLLDHRVLEFSLQLPKALVTDKRILKQLAYRYVPKRLLDRPKQGFGVPLSKWFRGQLRPMLTDALTPQRLQDVGVQDSTFVQRILKEHLDGVQNHSARLWVLFVLSLWGDKKL